MRGLTARIEHIFCFDVVGGRPGRSSCPLAGRWSAFAAGHASHRSGPPLGLGSVLLLCFCSCGAAPGAKP
jgi:hypothetical protein